MRYAKVAIGLRLKEGNDVVMRKNGVQARIYQLRRGLSGLTCCFSWLMHVLKRRWGSSCMMSTISGVVSSEACACRYDSEIIR